MADPKTNGPDPAQLLRRAEEAINAAGTAVEIAVLHVERPTADRLRAKLAGVERPLRNALHGEAGEGAEQSELAEFFSQRADFEAGGLSPDEARALYKERQRIAATQQEPPPPDSLEGEVRRLRGRLKQIALYMGWDRSDAWKVETARLTARNALDESPATQPTLEGEGWPEEVELYRDVCDPEPRPLSILTDDHRAHVDEFCDEYETRRYVPATQPTPSVDEGEAFKLALRHFESEANAADELGLDAFPGSPERLRYFTERDVYRYVLKRLREATQQPAEPTNGEAG